MNNVIIVPQLQSRSGYIEIIDDNGDHVYQATQETEEKLKLQENNEALKIQISSMEQSSYLFQQAMLAYVEGLS